MVAELRCVELGCAAAVKSENDARTVRRYSECSNDTVLIINFCIVQLRWNGTG